MTLRHALRESVWQAVDLAAAAAGKVGLVGRGPIPPRVLCYHRVCGAPPQRGTVEYYNVRPDAFRAQMDFLVREGFNVVTAAELAQAQAEAQAQARAHARSGAPGRGGMAGRGLPDRTVAVTFDDGYRNNHAVALPILREAGLKATFYVATAYTGGDGAFPWVRTDAPLDAAGRADPLIWQVMDWPEVQDLAARGMEVGSHSHTHPDFATLSPEAIRREVEASVGALRDRGIQVSTMAASFGVAGPAARALGGEVARAGLHGAFLGRAGPVSPEADPFDLPRITILESDSLETFARKLTGAYDVMFALHPWWRRVSRILEPTGAPSQDEDRVG